MENSSRHTIISKEFAQSFLDGMLEILGNQSIAKLVMESNLPVKINNLHMQVIDNLTPDQINSILENLEIQYGKVTSSGAMQQIGQISFHYLRKRILPIQNLGVLESRMLPLAQKMDTAFNVLDDFFTTNTRTKLSLNSLIGNTLNIDYANDWLNVKVHDCWLYYLKGFLVAFFEWMDSRRIFSIEVLKNEQQPSSFTLHVYMSLNV